MTVTVSTRAIKLDGDCPVEDAELLLVALQENRKHAIDVSRLASAHSAVIQILAMNFAAVRGRPANEFVRDILLPALPGTAQTK